MGCCCCCKGEEKDHGGLRGIEKENRGCTDLIPLLLFILGWVISIAIINAAVGTGSDADILTKPYDMSGTICGTGTQVDFPLGAWPYPPAYDSLICVKSCDETLEANSKRIAFPYRSAPVLGYCLPDPLDLKAANGTISIDLSGSFQTTAEALGRAVGDLYTAWAIILISSFLAIVNAYFFIGVGIRRCASCIVWSCLLVIILLACLVTYAAYSWGTETKKNPGSEWRGDAAVYTSYVLMGLIAIFVCVMCFLRKQIQIAIQVVKEAAHTLTDIPMIIFFPIWPILLAIPYMAYWCMGALQICSVADLTNYTVPDTVRTRWPGASMSSTQLSLNGFSTTDLTSSLWALDNPEIGYRYTVKTDWRYAAAWHFFHLLWCIQFLKYFAYLVFAGVASEWYFTPYDDKGDKPRGDGQDELSHSPICASVKRTLRYHLGTISITSFIIATIQMIRACVLYLEKQTKGDPPSKIQKACFSCLHCCLWMIECCMDKVNKNALIWTAVFGDGFCTACCSSFALIWKNLFRVAAINTVSTVVLLISKLSVGLMTMGICGMVLTNLDYYKENIYSPWFPSVVIFFMAYAVAHFFMNSFSAIIDTIFLCFLIDCDVNKDQPEGMCANKALQDLVGAHSDASKENFERLKAVRDRRGFIIKEQGTEMVQTKASASKESEKE